MIEEEVWYYLIYIAYGPKGLKLYMVALELRYCSLAALEEEIHKATS